MQGLFSYHVPAELTVQVGDILTVPFGSQQLGAIALRCHRMEPPNDGELRPVTEVIAQGFFPPGYWPLLERVAAYYATSLMQVIRTALPPKLLGKSQRRVRLAHSVPAPQSLSVPAQAVVQQLQQAKQGSYTWRYLKQQVRGADRALRELIRQGYVESFLETPASCQPKLQRVVTLLPEPAITPSLPGKALTAKQQTLLTLLRQRGGELSMAQLLEQAQVSDSTVKTLEKKQWVTIERREVLRLEGGDASGQACRDQPKTLTPDQAQALQTLHNLDQFCSVLLHGVTGSGKTEVYLQAIAPILTQGASALVLVPEIGLTPQLTDRFRQRFGDRVCVYHSGLSPGERYDTWRQMLMGRPQVVIGTRSAVFAPLPRIGLIILDEEHDSSFKQDQPMPCYHARTVARWRAQAHDCPLLLGSATPSAETWFLHAPSPERLPSPDHADPVIPTLYLSLPQRIHARPHPPVEIVDLREELIQGNRSVFSHSLQQAIADTLDQGRQGLLFIHRRGHSTFVSCRSCGEALTCPHCDVSLAYHHTHREARPILRCHYCNYVQGHPQHCPSCQSPYLKNFGSGTQRITQDLKQLFPQLRIIRYDSDTTRTKGAHRRLLDRFAAGEADFLVGTQMLTKGIDLPQVTLVGIVAADGLLHQADFRAAERACQTLLQVAGRAGRGEIPGRVILQTYTPEHPVIAAVQQQSYPPFLEAELQERAALHYPPQGQLILLRLSGPHENEVMATADRLARQLEQQLLDRYTILGPAPAAIARVADRYRWQLLLKQTARARADINPPVALLEQLMQLRQSCPSTVGLTIDVDPLYLN